MHRLFYLLLSLLAITVSLAFAQLGEVAGPLNFSIRIGSSETLHLTLVNGGSSPIGYKVVINSETQIANTMTPQIILSPQNGTIAPHSDAVINVTVNMPNYQKNIGKTWQATLSALEVQNITISGTGAIIQAGVLKVVNITALPPKTNWLIIAGIGVVVVAAVGGGSYYYYSRKRAAAMAAAKRKAMLARARTRTVAKRGKTHRRVTRRRAGRAGARATTARRRATGARTRHR